MGGVTKNRTGARNDESLSPPTHVATIGSLHIPALWEGYISAPWVERDAQKRLGAGKVLGKKAQVFPRGFHTGKMGARLHEQRVTTHTPKKFCARRLIGESSFQWGHRDHPWVVTRRFKNEYNLVGGTQHR